MTISVVSFNGHAVNDGTIYTAFFRVEDSVKRRTVGTSTLTPAGKHPRLTATTRQDAVLPLSIRIRSGDLQEKQDELDQWFAAGTTGDLVVDFGDDRRRLSCTVQQIVPYDGAPNLYTAVLLAPDARWKSGWQECHNAGGLQWSGGVITDTTRTTGTDGDGASNQDSVGIWRASENLWPNGGFESNTTGWVTFGTNTLATSTEKALFGSQSAKVTVGSSLNLISEAATTVSSSTIYVATIWCYIPSADWTGTDDIVPTITFDAGTPTIDFQSDIDYTVTDQWQRARVRFLTGPSTTSVAISYGFTTGGTSGDFCYFDGAQLEEKYHPTPYIETDGSTATRTAARVQIDAASASLSETQSWIAMRIRSGFTEDPSGAVVHPLAYAAMWNTFGTDHILLRYQDKTASTGAWEGGRRASSTGSSVSITSALAEGDEVTVIFTWTATQLGLSVAGSVFSTTADANIPSLSDDTLDIGSDSGSGQLDGDVIWFAAGTGTLTDADAASIAAFGNTFPTTWPEASGHCLSWVADDLAADTNRLTVTNAGSVPADDLVITVQPLSAKAAADDWIYKREVVLANRIGNGFSNYAIEMTGGGWDHAAAVSAGRSQADGDDVRLIVNGEERPRWVGGSGSTDWDQTGTLIWGNVSMSAGLESELLTAMASGASPAVGEAIEFESGALAGWPTAGTMLIGDEAIDYSVATLGDSKDTVTVVARGARNTTAAAHSAGASAFWVEHRIQLVYGHTGATAPDAQDHLKPMLDLANSSNLEHVWGDFAHETDPRSMQWSRVLRTRDSQSGLILAASGEPATTATLEFRSGGPVAGKPNFNGWARDIPSGTRYGSSNHAMTVANLVVDESVTAQFYGTDGDGNEVPLLNEGLGASGVSASTDTDDPDAPVYAIEISARNGIVVASPGGEYTNATLGGVDLTSTDGLITNGSPLAQPFTVPESLTDAAYIDQIAILAKCNAGLTASVILNVSVAQDDGAGGYVAFGTDQATVAYDGVFTGYTWYVVTLSDRVRVTPGQRLFVYAEWDSIGSGSPTSVGWYTIQASFEDRLISHAARVMSTTLDAGPNAAGVDGDSAVAQKATVYLDDIDDRYPYVSMQARQDLYWLDGTLTNTTNGDALTFQVPAAVDDVVVIDVAARTARNTTQDLSALNSVTFTDAERWMELEPGANVLTYVEDAVVSTRAQVQWSHRWES